MGRASRQNKDINDRTVLMAFSSDELRDEYHDFLKRARSLLESAKTFIGELPPHK